MATCYFTLDSAQALLPSVKRQLGQALQLHGHLRARISQLDELGLEVSWAMLRGDEPAEEPVEVSPTQALDLERARMLYVALRESVSEIEALGIEVKAVMDGLVDFRSWHEGRDEVFLCWKLGEPSIQWFHGLDDGFDGRRSVDGERFTDTREPELHPEV